MSRAGLIALVLAAALGGCGVDGAPTRPLVDTVGVTLYAR